MADLFDKKKLGPTGAGAFVAISDDDGATWQKRQLPGVVTVGYTTATRQGNRRAFFLDGDEILVASEGEVLKKRYRVVRIGVNSVVLEDIEFKAERTLPLEPQVG